MPVQLNDQEQKNLDDLAAFGFAVDLLIKISKSSGLPIGEVGEALVGMAEFKIKKQVKEPEFEHTSIGHIL